MQSQRSRACLIISHSACRVMARATIFDMVSGLHSADFVLPLLFSGSSFRMVMGPAIAWSLRKKISNSRISEPGR
jgi:hypothetical protein